MTPEQPLLDSIDARPTEEGPRLADAAWLEGQGATGRAEMIRIIHGDNGLRKRCPGLPPLEAFPEPDDLRQVLDGLRNLQELPADRAGDLQQQYMALFRTGVALDPERLRETLRLQYHFQVHLLRSLRLLEESENEQHEIQTGITAIDEKWYPLPTLKEIRERLQTDPLLQQKLRQGFDTLLLVPFGLPLKRFVATWREGLRRNRGRVEELDSLDEVEPVSYDEDLDESLVYEPQQFARRRHGGRTKAELLSGGQAWRVVLVESLLDLPLQDDRRIVGGRSQIECGQSADAYLARLTARRERGLGPEDYVLLSLDALERRGVMLEHETVSLLVGSYSPGCRFVPGGCWRPGDNRADLGGFIPADRDVGIGVRAAVRVLPAN